MALIEIYRITGEITEIGITQHGERGMVAVSAAGADSVIFLTPSGDAQRLAGYLYEQVRITVELEDLRQPSLDLSA
ncbi:MAG TPA: hypothetical protein PLP22_07940 [Candidatus Competibacter sp.]|nr:hypothetical protein [Candidatus Competibacteraceae bacterium]HRE54706.1 hypothetical protein [Candidatus Competibacter sp.]HUM93305.1 hypothetical protein [Candidatus Competibacter sp.]